MKSRKYANLLVVIVSAWSLVAGAQETEDRRQRARGRDPDSGQAYRAQANRVVELIEFQPGEDVVDIGAGDGWWARRFAESIGSDGIIHAGEISEKKVEAMREHVSDTTNVRPYVCPLDGTGLDDDTCDVAFISKTYHHLDANGRVAYLRGLKSVLRDGGRLVVTELHRSLAKGRLRDHAYAPGILMEEAQKAGWMCIRYELLKGTRHFVAVFEELQATGDTEGEGEG